MKPTFELDRKGIRDILNGVEAISLIDRATEAAAEEGRRTAPRGQHPGRHYADSIGIQKARRTDQGAVGAVTTDDPFWHLVEFGSVNNPPYRTLTRAVQSIGLKVED